VSDNWHYNIHGKKSFLFTFYLLVSFYYKQSTWISFKRLKKKRETTNLLHLNMAHWIPQLFQHFPNRATEEKIFVWLVLVLIFKKGNIYTLRQVYWWCQHLVTLCFKQQNISGLNTFLHIYKSRRRQYWVFPILFIISKNFLS
jgi:hypothetical protein